MTVPRELPGIDLAHDEQVRLWESWLPFLQEARSLIENWPAQRYQRPSASYDIGDAVIYTCMLRHLRPARLIEIGSGSSSAVALDAFDLYFIERPRTSFIEPYPALLHSLLKSKDFDAVEIIPAKIQDIPTSFFENLQKDDVLFIDSTHVLTTGSDVVYELFEVLPTLQQGVVVHFHDVFFPSASGDGRLAVTDEIGMLHS